MSPITAISPVVITPIDAGLKPAQSGGAGAFASVLSDAVGRMDQIQKSTSATVDGFLSGENEEVHQVALATQRSELAFDMFMQVRNKFVSAYQEVMRMQM
jgi:flagellar hook-basal body complex protein FliE